MSKGWSKGFTKYTHPSIAKISQTMKSKKVDNFRVWREKMKAQGAIKSRYPLLKRNGDLAELIGVVLGDGHIRKFPRTEELSIFANSNNPGFINRYADLVDSVFNKKPSLTKHGAGCTRIRIYQKLIQSRIGVPYSPRGHRWIIVPEWILKRRMFVVRYLRGLYEAEGSHCVHEKTSTYKLLFSNRNVSMLRNVYMLVKGLGFHPHRSTDQVQLSRKEEVSRFMKLIQFRKYR